VALPGFLEGGRLTSRPVLRTLALLGLLAPVGCSQPAGPVDEDGYVDLMAQLSYAETRYLDSTRADSARRTIMEAYGVTAADLIAFSERNGRDVERMFRLHELIRARVDSLEAIEAGALPGVEETPLDSEDGR